MQREKSGPNQNYRKTFNPNQQNGPRSGSATNKYDAGDWNNQNEEAEQ
jgi:hypothetical protein